jgi:hypothetical protein
MPSWIGRSWANLNLILVDPTGKTVMGTYSTNLRTETVTFSAQTLGIWKLGVKAKSGASSYALNVWYLDPPTDGLRGFLVVFLINDGTGTGFATTPIPETSAGNGVSVAPIQADPDPEMEFLVTNRRADLTGPIQLIDFTPPST